MPLNINQSINQIEMLYSVKHQSISQIETLNTNQEIIRRHICFISAHGEDWVFQKIEDFAGFTPNYYMYQAVTKDIMTECFQYCSVNKECSIVKITKTECYCSVYPIKDNFVMKINPDDHTKVYFKRPLGGKVKLS